MNKTIYIILIFLVLFSITGSAKIKIVERSSKKAPEWVNATQKDYIITSAIASQLNDAKEQCFNDIRKTIIEAVAQNVKSSSQNTIQQTSIDEGISQFLDSYTSTFQTEAAQLPYLTGISESKAEDSYWEKRQDTETKEISYLYSVKYPFPSLEVKKLVRKFLEQDKAMEEQLFTLEKLYEDVRSIKDIDKAITDLKPLIEYFFDPIRQEKAKSLQQNFQNLYRQIILKEIKNELGEYVFTFTLDEHPILVPQRPILKSETLSQLRAELINGQWHVFYNHETCDPSETNSGEIIFTIGGKKMTHMFYADIASKNTRIVPIREIHVEAKQQSDSTVSDLSILMTIKVDSDSGYYLRNMTLHIPGLATPVYIKNINIRLQAGNTQNIQLVYPQAIRIIEKQSFRNNILQGTLEISNEKGQIQQVHFSLPFQANW